MPGHGEPIERRAEARLAQRSGLAQRVGFDCWDYEVGAASAGTWQVVQPPRR